MGEWVSPENRDPPGLREYKMTLSIWNALSVEHNNMLEACATPWVGVENSIVMLFHVENAADVSSIIRQMAPSSEGDIWLQLQTI